MKKTFTINISGTIFHIEEDAYEILQKYLVNLKKHFGAGEEGKEIIADIEARLAELFSEKSNEKKVITLNMVNEVVAMMGTPEDFMEDESEEQEEIHTPGESKRKRRLYRDPDHRVLGGVCGGLGAYFNMDPVILRIIFAILFFITFPAAMIAYIILWIAVPKAITTAQRLEMRGQEATVKNIEKSIKEEVKEVKESYRKFKESDTYSKGRKSAEAAGDVTYNVFKVILKVLVVVFGAILIIAGFLGLIGFLSSMIVGHSFVEGWPLVWGPEIHFPVFMNYFVDPLTVTWGMILVGLLVGIPILGILFIGTKLVFRYKTNNTAIGLSMVGVWLIALVSLIVVSVGQVGNFKSKTSSTDSEIISCDSCQTLTLKLGEDLYQDFYTDTEVDIEDMKVVVVDGENILLGEPKLDIQKSGNDEFVILVKKASRGKSYENAKASIDDIIYRYELKDSTIYFEPYFYLDNNSKWRVQEVDIVVKVPVGKSVYLGHNMIDIIYDIDNVSNTWDRDMVGKTWIMTDEGLAMKETEY
ncbi:MAG: PspC domain-containing protein [Prolixibacteraceae bacterium]|nr:PspC domain-containing protein [Prolixibacteraceae bacterium]